MTGTGIDRLFGGELAGPLFLVEAYWPGVSAARVAAADVETARALQGLGDGSHGADHLGSLLVPGDELLLRLFRQGSAELVKAANVLAGVPVERVVEIVALAPQLGAIPELHAGSGIPLTTAQRRGRSFPSPER
jgi:hypothetical protein